MYNPFCVPGCSIDAPGPLNPCKIKNHEDYYVNVDHTEKSYQEFIDNFKQYDVANAGAIAIVHGEDGCGKTSLINRCSLYASVTLSQKLSKVLIIDRSNEHLVGQSIPSKCEDTVSAVLREIKLSDKFVSKVILDQLPSLTHKSDENELRRIINDVTAYLCKENCILIIIPPKIELFEEFKSYLSIFSRGSVVLIMETNDEGVKQSVNRWNRTSGNRKVHSLGVGPIEAEQGWSFVQSRMMSTEKVSSQPTFEKESVNKYMENRCKHAKVSIREFELVCIRLFEEANRNGNYNINYGTFCDFWVKYGGGII